MIGSPITLQQWISQTHRPNGCNQCRIAARLASEAQSRDHITPVLHNLYWLAFQCGNTAILV